ncbi:MAG TPA: phage virion morphogenesis protein [Candidatus Saccharimonadales bacterium]|nr:phage virion morphogenesis protein [Candidatus Saccharimonadales bacterium]
MPTIVIKINGDKTTEKKLRRLGGSLLDMSKAMRAVGNDFLGFYTDKPFTSQGGIYGSPWAALKPATVDQKVKYNPTTATYPLIKSGKMRRSFKVESSSTHMRLFNTTDYFKYHQLGTKNMPQRMVLQLTKSRYDAVKRIIEADIKDKINRA